jgi:hypothetical protein
MRAHELGLHQTGHIGTMLGLHQTGHIGTVLGLHQTGHIGTMTTSTEICMSVCCCQIAVKHFVLLPEDGQFLLSTDVWYS